MYQCLEQPSLATWQLTEDVDIMALPSASAPRSIAPTVTLATPTQPGATLDAASVSLAAHAAQQQQQQFIAELDDGAGLVHELPGESAKRHYAELPSQPPPVSLPQSPAVPSSPFPPSPYTSTWDSQMDGGTNVSLDSRFR